MKVVKKTGGGKKSGEKRVVEKGGTKVAQRWHKETKGKKE